MAVRTLLVLVVLSSFLLVGAASAQDPVISLYKTLDKSPIGPWDTVPYMQVSTIYVVVENADMMVGGASFRIENSNGFPVLGYWTPDGVAIGDLFTGIEIGLTTPVPQFGAPAIIASFQVLADRPTTVTMSVLEHPDESDILVADSDGALSVARGNTLTLTAPIHPEIGLFFDAAGTRLDGTFNGGAGETVTGYLMLRAVEHSLDIVTARLVLPADMSLVSTEYPAGCTVTGDLAVGANLNFDPRLTATPGSVLLATVTLAVGTEVGADLPLTVAGDGLWSYGPYIYIDPYGPYSAVPLTSTVTIPVGNRDESWGGVKALFR